MAFKGNLVFGLIIWLCLVSPSLVRGRRLVASQMEGFSHDGGDSTEGRDLNETTASTNLLNAFVHPSASYSSPVTQHWATYITKEGNYFGTKATINVWGVPDIKSHQSSATVISIWNKASAIQVGVHVQPELYHDNKLHFFTRWSIDNNGTGCYNLQCPGFVLVNSSLIAPGYWIKPLSVYGGQQYVIKISIKQDPDTNDWLVLRDNQEGSHLVGYWPKLLLKDLGNFATNILWGGTVGSRANTTGPAMGSGHDPSEGDGKAAYLKNIALFNGLGDPHPLKDGDQSAYTDREDCYKVSPLYNSGETGSPDGHFFYFGGPAGCPN